jgi:penicillin V acylase-like amidase (Ntn superfamily)
MANRPAESPGAGEIRTRCRIVTALNLGVSDGINEDGLAAHLLCLDKTQYEPRGGRLGVANALWIQ